MARAIPKPAVIFDRARDLLRQRPGLNATETRLLLASGGGFADGLRRIADTRADIVLVDLDELNGRG